MRDIGWAIADFGRHYRLAAVGGLIVVAFLLTGLFAPWLAPREPNRINIVDRLQPPSLTYPLGTDNQGRDLLSRIIYGARVSLTISVTSVAIGAVLGVLLGLLAAYYPRIDGPIMRLMDVLLVFPGIIVALTIISILGRGIENLIVAIAIYEVPQFARLARGLALSVKENEYVQAARALGATDATVLRRHILPNCLAPILIQVSLLIPAAIMTGASLSFLGLGVPPPTAEWGAMLQNSLQWASMAPHVMIVPGLVLMLIVFGFNVLGDGLRDALDPRLTRLRRRRAALTAGAAAASVAHRGGPLGQPGVPPASG